jgi:hypothetical protein
MRRSVLSLAALAAVALMSAPLLAQAGPPRPSPRASVSQVFGVTELTIDYSRPAVRGREIWGGLVPWDKVWRTGANEATTFTVSDDVKVEGKALPAGKYAFFTIPRKDHWTLIFNKVNDQWGAFDYDEKQDVLRVDVKPVQSGMQERMEFLIDEFDDTSADVVLRWENVAVPFTITVDTGKAALAKAEKELATGTPKAGAYVSWARWLQEHDVAPAKARAWVEKAIAMPEGKRFWAYAVDARLLAKAGETAAAKKAAEQAIELAKTEKSEVPLAPEAEKLRQEMARW